MYTVTGWIKLFTMSFSYYTKWFFPWEFAAVEMLNHYSGVILLDFVFHLGITSISNSIKYMRIWNGGICHYMRCSVPISLTTY